MSLNWVNGLNLMFWWYKCSVWSHFRARLKRTGVVQMTLQLLSALGIFFLSEWVGKMEIADSRHEETSKTVKILFLFLTPLSVAQWHGILLIILSLWARFSVTISQAPHSVASPLICLYNRCLSVQLRCQNILILKKHDWENTFGLFLDFWAF